MKAKTLMVQGTASNVGKSVLTAALCRLFRNKGWRVAPFKAQNMSNNSYVCRDGGEIGRAQAVQAEACGIEPSTLMNPILLKPSADSQCQVVIMGKARSGMGASEYYENRAEFEAIADSALERLIESHELVVIEGAGSPAEMNMKDRDITNMRIAKKFSSPVILVGDIDKGGVFAQLCGTFDLLDEKEKELTRAFIINKFRGDKNILEPGLRWIEDKTDRKVLGVVPFMPDLQIGEEDAVVLEKGKAPSILNQNKIVIAVVRLPRISNFTDFESLARESGVNLQYMEKPMRNVLPDLVIIPGTKSTIADLKFLRSSGFADYIRNCHRAGVPVIGICGGYQMLGRQILDPDHVESESGSADGLGMIPAVTTFVAVKKTVQVRALHAESGAEVRGYEIHMGRTQFLAPVESAFNVFESQPESNGHKEGVYLCAPGGDRSPFILGTYIHGLFDSDGFRRFLLKRVRAVRGIPDFDGTLSQSNDGQDDAYDRLAQRVAESIDTQALETILEGAAQSLYTSSQSVPQLK
ncbi:MAG: cobyric acid synthase [Candidatus Omnitrophota bacterium]|nr:cobyric acid synthase [Candidatus Omnitrophota bacterium]